MTALMGITTKLRLAKLALVVPASVEVPEIIACAKAGADLLVLSSKGCAAVIAAERLNQVRSALIATQTLVGSDSAKIAEAASADLVFVQKPSWFSRRVAKPHAYAQLGRGLQSVDDLSKIIDAQFSFGFLGPAWYKNQLNKSLTQSAQHYPAFAQPNSPVWFAAGGINGNNLAEVLGVGVRRVAVSRAIFTSNNPVAAVAMMAKELTAVWRSDPAAAAYTDAAFLG